MNDRNRLRTLGPSPASLPPLSFFSLLFVSYSDLSASSIPGPVLPTRHIVPCCMQKAQFYPIFLLSITLFFHLRLLPPPVSLQILHRLHRGCDKSSIRLCTSLYSLAVFTIELAVNRDHVPFSKEKSTSYAKLYIFIKKIWLQLDYNSWYSNFNAKENLHQFLVR